MENMIAEDIEQHRTDPLEQRVFRLESAAISMAKTEGEMMDRLKNAHHRIDETQGAQLRFQNAVAEKFRDLNTKVDNVDTKVDNLGLNLAKKEEQDRKTLKKIKVIAIIAAIFAFAAFIGVFVQDAEIRKGIGEIAIGLGIKAATVI